MLNTLRHSHWVPDYSRAAEAIKLAAAENLRLRALREAEQSSTSTSFAIEGEDINAYRLFKDFLSDVSLTGGTYVDIGCHDPIAASNTYLFYKKGWRGLCVDANPAFAERFRQFRPEDTFVCTAVGDANAHGTYYRFDNPLVNGFYTAERALEISKALGSAIEGNDEVPFRTLNSLLNDYFRGSGIVDLFSIDVETMEEKILASWDFERWPARLIACEIQGQKSLQDISLITQHPLSQFLRKIGYTHLSRFYHTCFFVNHKLPPLKKP